MIVYCCRDLIFATKIRATAEGLGLSCRPARDLKSLRDRLEQVEDGRLNEPVSGVIVDLDLADDGLMMVEQVKAGEDQIPVVAFGSHVETSLLEAARQRGADFVLPRSTFTATLPDILQRLAIES